MDNRARIFNATLIVSLAFVVSRLLGLVRDGVFNYYFGVDSLAADAYSIVSPTPELIFTVIAGGALGSAFIPTLAAYLVHEEREAEAWRLFSAILNLVVLTATGCALVAALLAPQLLQALYGALLRQRPGLLEMAVPLLRLMLLSPIIFGASGVVMAALNARQHFLLPALAGAVYNVGIMLGTVALAPDIMGVGLGTVLGAIGHLLIQLPALRRVNARYSLLLTLRDPGVRQVLWLMAPRVLGLSFSYLNLFITPLIAQSMTTGALRALNSAFRLVLAPQGVLGQAVGIASFPTFALLAADEALAELRRIISDTLRLIIFLGLPIMIIFMVARQPIIALAYERGNFDAAATALASWALLFYALALISLALIEVMARAFYALKDTVTPVVTGGLQIVAMTGLSLWLGYDLFPRLGWPGLGGVALGYALSNGLEMALLLWLLRRRLQGLEGGRLVDGAWRMGAAGLLMAGVMWLTLAALETTPRLWQLAAPAAAGGVIYLAGCYSLKVTELHLVLRRLRRFRGG